MGPLMEADPWLEVQGQSQAPARRSRGRPRARPSQQEEVRPGQDPSARALVAPRERAHSATRGRTEVATRAARPMGPSKRRGFDWGPQGRPIQRAQAWLSSGPRASQRGSGKRPSAWAEDPRPKTRRVHQGGSWKRSDENSRDQWPPFSAQESRPCAQNQEDAGQRGWGERWLPPESRDAGQNCWWRSRSRTEPAQSDPGPRSATRSGQLRSQASGASQTYRGKRGHDWAAGESGRW